MTANVDRRGKDRRLELVERTLPHDLDAEKATIGAAIAFDASLKAVVDVLTPGDFFRDVHRKIFTVLLDLHEAGVAADLVTVKDALATAGELDEIGGPAYLASLTDGIPRASNILHYANIIKEKARLRQTIYTAQKLLTQAYGAEDTATKLVSDAAERLLALSDVSAVGAAKPLGEISREAVDGINAAIRAGTALTGCSTGFTKLDDMTSGLQPSDVVIIAARTSVGKTALMLNIVRSVADVAPVDDPVLVFSLEMSKRQLFLRMLAAEARVNSQRLRLGYTLTDTDWTLIGPALVALDHANIYIDDTPSITIGHARARARAFKAQRGLKLVAIDYVQLMRGSGRFENRTQEVGNVSRGVKAMAKELNVPVVMLAQLSRKPEGRANQRPRLSDLRESGDLEQDADVVLLIYRPDPKPEDDDSSIVAEINVAKQRNGPTGVMKVLWRAEFTKFENYL